MNKKKHSVTAFAMVAAICVLLIIIILYRTRNVKENELDLGAVPAEVEQGTP